jgi:hypothetical protein
MRAIPPILLSFVLLWFTAPAGAPHTSPQVGWRAARSCVAPPVVDNVSGSVTILDENTSQVDDFTYAGGGISVYFYLGREQSRDAFRNGLQIGDQLLTRVFNGSGPPLVIDLPAGQTLEGWNAISVWCVAAFSSFGDGTFAPASGPPSGDFNDDGSVDAADYVAWRNGLGGEYDENDHAEWRANFGTNATAAAPNPAPFPMTAVPEPFSRQLLIAAWLLAARCSSPRRKR